MTVISGSHKKRIFEHYDDEGNWTGKINSADHDSIDWSKTMTLPCSAWDALILRPLTVHSSGSNKSELNRPYLIHGMSATDAIFGSRITGD